jgi:hypothetical protein
MSIVSTVTVIVTAAAVLVIVVVAALGLIGLWRDPWSTF